MIVCVCKAISDRQIRALVRDGAGLREIMANCQAGGDCGTCIGQIKEMVAEVRDENPPLAQQAAGNQQK